MLIALFFFQFLSMVCFISATLLTAEEELPFSDDVRERRQFYIPQQFVRNPIDTSNFFDNPYYSLLLSNQRAAVSTPFNNYPTEQSKPVASASASLKYASDDGPSSEFIGRTIKNIFPKLCCSQPCPQCPDCPTCSLTCPTYPDCPAACPAPCPSTTNPATIIIRVPTSSSCINGVGPASNPNNYGSCSKVTAAPSGTLTVIFQQAFDTYASSGLIGIVTTCPNIKITLTCGAVRKGVSINTQYMTISDGQTTVPSGGTVTEYGFMQVIVSRVPSSSGNSLTGLTVSCQWLAAAF